MKRKEEEDLIREVPQLPTDVWSVIFSFVKKEDIVIKSLFLVDRCFSKLVEACHTKKIARWRKRQEVIVAVAEINKKRRDAGVWWFICHSCNQLYIEGTIETHNLPTGSDDTQIEMVCHTCAHWCGSCCRHYCAETDYMHEDCEPSPIDEMAEDQK